MANPRAPAADRLTPSAYMGEVTVTVTVTLCMIDFAIYETRRGETRRDEAHMAEAERVNGSVCSWMKYPT